MNEHEQYMADFMKIFEKLERWGPGSKEETLQALSKVPFGPQHILEIGCGKGLTTTLLAENTTATITAVDNESSALEELSMNIETTEFASRITPVVANMTELPFDKASFDLVWAEGCAYIMGVTNALSQWRALLKENGVLMVSDLVWLTDTPSDETKAFFNGEYPDIQTVNTRISQMKAAHYEVLDHFTLSRLAWENYVLPLQARVEELKSPMPDCAALDDIAKELDIYRNYLGEFGYQMFLLRSNAS